MLWVVTLNAKAIPPQVSPNLTVYERGVGVGSGVLVMVGVTPVGDRDGDGVIVMVAVAVADTCSGDEVCPRVK
jgi:hypothetical protein